jgi:hypothetical protein
MQVLVVEAGAAGLTAAACLAAGKHGTKPGSLEGGSDGA